jgi:MFS family permease
MTAALGSGAAVWFLPLADLGPAAWRLLYVIPLVGIPLAIRIGRRLPESHRFEAARERAPMPTNRRRVWLLAVSGFLLLLFAAPASQFQNEYLRTERDFSAAGITAFTLLTNTPGGIGILVGGRLSDVRGRRLIGAIGVLGGVGFTVLMYFSAGWSLWMASVVGAVVGAAVVPALGVYGPELFPTSARGRANGIISVVGVAGSSVGLLLAGQMADSFGEFGPAMAVLAVGPLLLAVLVLVAYPETAHQELEDLNPEDRVRGDPRPADPADPPVTFHRNA